jgi:hypothetical protein
MKLQHPLIGFLLLSSTFLSPIDARSDTPAVNGFVPSIELSTVAPLQVKVTLEAKQQPIAEFLAELTKQSHIKLSVAPDVPVATARVTARLSDYALADAMLGLEQLYNIRWSRVSDGEYILNRPVGNEFDRQLAKVGDIGRFSQRQYGILFYGEDGKISFHQEVAAQADIAQMRSVEGVPVAELPDDVQAAMRRRIEHLSSLWLVELFYGARVPVVDGYTLKLRPRRGHNQPETTGFSIEVLDPRGSWQLPLPEPQEPLEAAE